MNRTLKLVTRAATAIVIGLVSHASSAASFDYEYRPTGGICFMGGVIEKGDEIKLRNTLSKGCNQINVNSLGGSVDTALKMGRMIRNAAIGVSIGDRGECASACVFLYAGGVSRAPYGPVKIHRPYLSSPEKSLAATKQRYAKMEVEVKAFLREMNVKEELFDRMMRISPEDVVPISLEYMESIGMGLNDPVHAEFEDSIRAQERGFSKRDWLSRKKAAKTQCGEIDGTMTREVFDQRRACWSRVFPEFF